MAVKVEQKEKGKVSLEVSVEAEQVTKAYDQVARKASLEMNIPGFRKGKAPRYIVEKYIDKGYLRDRVIEILIQSSLFKAIQESEVIPVSTPKVDVMQIEEGKEFIFVAEIEVKPEVELGQYTGLVVEKKTAEVTDEEVEENLKRRQEMYARLLPVDRPVEEGDIVTIDFEGFVDGAPFEGGQMENHDLTVGSGQFIPGFEEQLIGAERGQDLEIKVRFPKDYPKEDLADKEALFKVKIKVVKEKVLSELDDEFAKDVSEFETLEELKADIKQNLLAVAQQNIESEYRAEVLKQVVDNASVEIPEGMIEERAEMYVQDMGNKLASQGIPEKYCTEYINSNREKLKESYRTQAAKDIKTELVLEAIGEKEQIKASDEDLEREIQKIASEYNMKPAELLEKLKASGEIHWLRQRLTANAVIDFILDNVAEKEDTSSEIENTLNEKQE
ncbi:MAG: trigger factor [Desulfitobacteriia bacterium]|jgi:trigger factor